MKYNFTYCRYTKANARITRNILPLLGSAFEIPTNNEVIDEKYIKGPREFLVSFETSSSTSKFCDEENPSTLSDKIRIDELHFETDGRYTVETIIKYNVSLLQTEEVIVYFEPFYVQTQKPGLTH